MSELLTVFLAGWIRPVSVNQEWAERLREAQEINTDLVIFKLPENELIEGLHPINYLEKLLQEKLPKTKANILKSDKENNYGTT